MSPPSLWSAGADRVDGLEDALFHFGDFERHRESLVRKLLQVKQRLQYRRSSRSG